jgi:hypothetical protein
MLRYPMEEKENRADPLSTPKISAGIEPPRTQTECRPPASNRSVNNSREAHRRARARLREEYGVLRWEGDGHLLQWRSWR